MMTSFAFILGVVPLVLSDGAGAEMRRTLGTAVFGGMLGVTLFGIFLTPVFYYVIEWFTELRQRFAPANPEGRRGRGRRGATDSEQFSQPAHEPATDGQHGESLLDAVGELAGVDHPQGEFSGPPPGPAISPR